MTANKSIAVISIKNGGCLASLLSQFSFILFDLVGFYWLGVCGASSSLFYFKSKKETAYVFKISKT